MKLIFVACLATICFASRMDRIIDLLEQAISVQSENGLDEIKFDGGSEAPQVSSVYKWTGSYYEGTHGRYLMCCKHSPPSGTYKSLYWTIGTNKDDGCKKSIVKAHIGNFQDLEVNCPREFLVSGEATWEKWDLDEFSPQPKVEICTADTDCDQSEDKYDKIKFDGGSAEPYFSGVYTYVPAREYGQHQWTLPFYEDGHGKYLTCCKSGPLGRDHYYRMFWTLGTYKGDSFTADGCKNERERAHMGRFYAETAEKVGCPREFLFSGDATWKDRNGEVFSPQPTFEFCTDTDCDE